MFVVCRMAEPGTPLAAALDPHSAWDVDTMLAAVRVDQANDLVWAISGGKGARPRPVPRPWDEPDNQSYQHFGNPMTRSEVDAMAARYRPRRTDGN